MIDSHYSYLTVLTLCGVFPAGISFFFRKFLKSAGFEWFNKSVIISAIPFLVWDIAAQARGHWFFDEKYICGVRLFGLPIEEYLFFLIIPQCCLLIWVALTRYKELNK